MVCMEIRGGMMRDGLHMRELSLQADSIFPAWVSASGPANDTAISTRARLARNIQGSPFPVRARDADLRRVSETVLAAVHDCDGRFGKLRVIHPSRLSDFERRALVDARVASSRHVVGGKHRPVIVNDSGTLSLMVNEEDHIRIQCILPGLQPITALEIAQEFDGFLRSRLGYLRSDEYGYMTSSLANIGTGLRLSVLLHLGGLSYMDEVVPALSAAMELRTSVRGVFGEGTDAVGDIYQVSNGTTIGFSEKEIACRVRAAAEHLISRERTARRRLAVDKSSELGNVLEGARNRLIEAHAVGGRESVNLLSLLRLGGAVGLAGGISPKTFNELVVSARMRLPSSGTPGFEGVGSDVKRAKYMKVRLLEESEALQLAFPE
jgi:protein arginine kinase